MRPIGQHNSRVAWCSCLFSLFCWPSATVKSGQKVERSSKLSSFSDTFPGLLEKVDGSCADRLVSRAVQQEIIVLETGN